jgi:two-component sensor histidine kinase/PAS domain-containing protein
MVTFRRLRANSGLVPLLAAASLIAGGGRTVGAAQPRQVGGDPAVTSLWPVVSQSDTPELPDQDFFHIAFEKDGTAWVAGTDGLYRYDGYRWQRFGRDEGLPSNYVRCVCVCRDGRLWVGTDRGAGEFDGRTFDRHGSEGGLAGPSVRKIVEDPDGGLWFCCDRYPDPAVPGGISHYHGGRWTTHTPANGLPGDHVVDYFRDSTGRRFALTNNALLQKEGDRWVLPLAAAGLHRGNHFWTAAESPTLGTVFSDRDGLYFLKDGRWRYVPGPSSTEEIFPYHLCVTRAGRLLTYCRQKDRIDHWLQEWDGGQFVALSGPRILWEGWIGMVAEAPDGAVWVVGNGKLVLRCAAPGPGWVTYRNLPPPAVVDDLDQVWFPGRDALIRHGPKGWGRWESFRGQLVPNTGGAVLGWDPQRLTRWPKQGKQTFDARGSGLARFEGCTADAAGNAWLHGPDPAGRPAAAVLKDGTWQPIAALGEPGDRVRQGTPAPDGSVWYLMNRAGRGALDCVSLRADGKPVEPPVPVAASLADPEYVQLTVDRAGGLWLRGFRQKLHTAPPGGTRIWLPVTTPLGSDAILLYDLPNGVWAAFNGQLGGSWGLGCFRGGKWEAFPLRVQGASWLPGGGMAFYQYDALQIVPPGPGAVPHHLTLPRPGRINGVVGQRSGDLWVGIEDTVYRYRPDGVPPRTLVRQAEQAVLQGTPLVVRVEARERYRPRSQNRKFLFSWRVDDGPWGEFRYLDAGTVELPTGALPPGEHVLRVRSQDEKRDIDSSPAAVHFVVTPLPLQQRAWFLPTLMALLLGISGLGAYAFLARRRIAGHAHQLEERVRARTRELEGEKSALRRSEERFQLAVRGSAEGLWDWNLVTGEVYYSPRCRELLGDADGAWGGVTEAFDARLHPEDRDRVLAALHAHLNDRTPFDLEHRFRTCAGDYHWFRSCGQAQWDAAGKPHRMVGSLSDITGRKRAEEQVLASLREKEALLREIHHRVKNNLQIITSLLNLQADRIPEPVVRAALAETRNRVRSMAMLHETLYRSKNLARIDVRKYVRELCDHLLRTYEPAPGRIDVRQDVADLEMDLDRAIPCGLIINELVSNALKYAFPDGRRGRVEIRLHPCAGGTYRLSVGDDGVGLPDGAGDGKALGLQLVRGLAGQLGGTFALHRDGGTTACVTFPT